MHIVVITIGAVTQIGIISVITKKVLTKFYYIQDKIHIIKLIFNYKTKKVKTN